MAAYDDYDYPRYWNKRKYEHLSEVIAIEDFFERIGKAKRVLDIGAGYGRLATVYNKYSKEITLAEPSQSLLQKAKALLSESPPRINYLQSTIENLSTKIPKKKFDVIILVRVMHHIKNPELAIKTAYSHLPSGGYFILEFANKLHGKALLTNFLSGNFTFPLDIFPLDKRSRKSIKKGSILFLNHHPDIIEDSLKNNGFKILEKRSVSNIRSRRIKEAFPLKYLMNVEEFMQKRLARFNFGPSVFILAQKK